MLMQTSQVFQAFSLVLFGSVDQMKQTCANSGNYNNSRQRMM